jgi:hypothetical protein
MFDDEEQEDRITMYLAYPEDEERPREVMLVLKDPGGMTSREAYEAIKDFLFISEEVADALFSQPEGSLTDYVSDGKVLM